MAREWTSEQLSAINTRDKSLLVSAAAGSGKTATLTQRIIESILDEESPVDINRILVVTFTKAAVGELRERISDAIKARLTEEGQNARLEKQLHLLPGAKIMTIDAFCNDCLKNFPDAAGISPGYRISDEAEIMIAAREIFDGIAEAAMRGELAPRVSPEEFDALTDCLVDTKKMADVFDVFRKAYTKLRTAKNGVDALADMVAEYDPARFTTVDGTVFGKYILDTEREGFLYRKELFTRLRDMLRESGGAAEKYAVTADADIEVYTRVANSGSYEEMKRAMDGFALSNLPPVKSDEKTPEMLLFKEARDTERDRIKKERERFFSYTEDMWRRTYGELHPLLLTFYKILSLFDGALFEHKKRRGTFDYTDVERLAYSALVRDGEPTDLALAMREEFLAVYIDEYQDVNDLQDAIFCAISKPDNKFTVGDIKQSIYGFRSANPEIFASAKKALPRFGEGEDGVAASLFMSTNFRSSRGVIDFVNSVFDRVFGAFADGIGYTPADRLRVGRQPLGESFSSVPEICLVPKGEVSYSVEDDEITEDASEALLPRVVAEKIREILDTGRREGGSPVAPSDIAIILRSMKDRSEKYVDALGRLGIPTRTSGKKDFFLNSDVLLALCLLNTINNPLRDVYLTGLLRSPIFDFTADDLVAIRGKDGPAAFYHSLRSFVAEHPEFEKGQFFLEKLERWREIAEGMRTDRLLHSLFRETGLLALAEEHGEKNNLIRFYEYARSFEGSSFGGLGGFISYINNVIADGEKFDCNIESAKEDAVTVISAHSSKGLEYPIVFFADADKRIQCKEAKEHLLIAQGFGAALRHRTPLGLALVENPMMNALAEKMKDENLEEELRVLYVALTRARERLYVVGAFPGKEEDEYLEKIRLRSLVPTAASYKRLYSHLEIILASTGAKPLIPEDFVPGSARLAQLMCAVRADIKEDPEIFSPEEFLGMGTPIGGKSNRIAEYADGDGEPDEDLKNEFARRFSYRYHSPHLTKLPEKLSVSLLYPTVLDGTEAYAATLTGEVGEPSEEGKRTVPEFISGGGATESKRRGIATHLFMQFFDIDSLYQRGAEGELSRLVGAGFLSNEEAGRVRIDEIKKFVGSELFLEMRRAKRLWREFRFNTALPAELFTDDEEKKAAVSGRKILVQGVIDCIMENPDGTLAVIDYKTDRLTRAELADEELANERLYRAHSLQLSYYRLAVKEIFGVMPTRAEVYSLHLGRCADVTEK